MRHLPIIVQSYHTSIVKRLLTNTYHPIEDGKIDITDPLIGVDITKYKQKRIYPDFIYYRIINPTIK